MTVDTPIHYRLKAKPDDFRVEELTDLRPKRRGEFRLYRLTKSGWNTVDLIVRIAKRSQVRLDDFSFGGRKDREAVTTQYVTVRSRRDLSLRELDYAFESLGYVEERMRPERLLGNGFTVVVRDLEPAGADAMAHAVETVSHQGLTNYFDDQRFGGFDPAGGFVAPRILRGEWEEALKFYLTSVRAEESETRRAKRMAIRKGWGSWKSCLALAETVTERRIFESLAFHGKRREAFAEAFDLVPRQEISMAFSSWQSFLWNEIASAATAALADRTATAPGAVGSYVFATRMSHEAFARYGRTVVPMPGPRPRFTDSRTADIYAAVLAANGFESEGLKSPAKLRAAYLKSFPRRLHLRPEELRVVERGADEMAPGRERLTIRFRVGRGSYGTMVVKRLAVREA
jgi:tRNA pseudouridine13 synthase